MFSATCTSFSGSGGVRSMIVPSETTIFDLIPTLSVAYTLLYIIVSEIDNRRGEIQIEGFSSK